MGAMTGHIPAEVFPPCDFLREEMEARGWTAPDLADLLGEIHQFADEILSDERALTPEIAD
jgi:HTH-type transcriptional regulator/antitoxin HigA